MADQAGQEAPVPSTDAAPEVAPEKTTAPETGTETATEKETTQAAKTFTQEELNDIVKRAKAATESKTERRIFRALEHLQKPTQPAPEVQTPTRHEGESEDAYIERLVEEKLARRAQNERFQTVAQKTESFYAEAEKVPGFDREVFDSLPLTQAMAQTLAEGESEVGPKLMAFLCENPGEVERIAKLPSTRQAAELGKLEARALQSKTKAAPPKAPAPISPVGGGKAPLTDMARMSADEYYEHRMKQKPVWAR